MPSTSSLPVFRILFGHLLLLATVALLGCSGGGGGSSTPQLNIGVDLTGTWSVNQRVTAVEGPCTEKVGDLNTILTAFEFTASINRIILDPGTADARVGTTNGINAVIVGSGTQGGVTTTWDIRLQFAADGNSFTGTVTSTESQGTTTCTVTSTLTGTRVIGAPAVGVVSTFPIDGARDVAYDASITAEFGRDIDPASVTSSSFVVTGPNGPIAGLAGTQGSTVTFTPNALLSVATRYTLSIGEDVRATDGGRLDMARTVAFETPLISEDFRYGIAQNGLVTSFLDTLANGQARVTSGAIGSLTPGQTWRFSFDRVVGTSSFFILRNDEFVNDLALEGGDGSGPATMAGYAPPGPFSGQLFQPEINGAEVTLRTLFQGSNRALGREGIGTAGEVTALMQDIQPGVSTTLWNLLPVQRIVPAFTLEPITTSSIIDGAFDAGDAQGLQSPAARADLYLLETTAPTRLTVTMRSAANTTGIDCFLFLLNDDCLNDPDLSKWGQCTIAADDDGGGNDPTALSTLDAKIDGFVLPAGRFVIGATYLGNTDILGPYMLQTEAAAPRVANPGMPAVLRHVERGKRH